MAQELIIEYGLSALRYFREHHAALAQQSGSSSSHGVKMHDSLAALDRLLEVISVDGMQALKSQSGGSINPTDFAILYDAEMPDGEQFTLKLAVDGVDMESAQVWGMECECWKFADRFGDGFMLSRN